jgi:hypothetical protein
LTTQLAAIDFRRKFRLRGKWHKLALSLQALPPGIDISQNELLDIRRCLLTQVCGFIKERYTSWEPIGQCYQKQQLMTFLIEMNKLGQKGGADEEIEVNESIREIIGGCVLSPSEIRGG